MNRLLPRSLDNVYRGKTLALWLFGLVIAIRLVQSAMILFNPYGTVRSADGIPLDAYPATAAQTRASATWSSGTVRRSASAPGVSPAAWRTAARAHAAGSSAERASPR